MRAGKWSSGYDASLMGGATLSDQATHCPTPGDQGMS